ncbi:hypothetical protein Hte_007976 [Hypoxylon texense]
MPGEHGWEGQFRCKRICRLVGIKQAKQLAVEVYGSMDKLPKLQRQAGGNSMHPQDSETFAWLRRAPLKPRDLSRRPSSYMDYSMKDAFSGAACLPFPHLGKYDVATYGFLCKDCEAIEDAYEDGELPPSIAIMSKYDITDVHVADLVAADIKRLRSEKEFLEHIMNCYGMRIQISKYPEEFVDMESGEE